MGKKLFLFYHVVFRILGICIQAKSKFPVLRSSSAINNYLMFILHLL